MGAGGVPSIQMALDEINANDSVLPGYTLRYELTDTKVCTVIRLSRKVKAPNFGRVLIPELLSQPSNANSADGK